MYVLYLSDINYPKKSVSAGEIYKVRIAPYHGGYALFSTTDIYDKSRESEFGSLQNDHHYFDLESATYITASNERLLKDFWNANKEHYLAVDKERKEQYKERKKREAEKLSIWDNLDPN